MQVVIARHKENIDWAPTIDYYVVQKGDHIPNVGREPASYLWYIINHYDELEGHYAFLQGNPFDHEPDILSKIKPHDFYWLGNKTHTCDMNAKPADNINLREFLNESCLEYNKEKIEFIAGCQFIVSAKQIKRQPIEYYSRLYEIVLREDKRYPWAFERFVKLIFTGEQ